MDDDGQIIEGHSISAGLDYPGIGPEHSWLHDMGRVNYVSATDKEALEAFQLCCKLEGIIPALEPSHALAHVMKLAPKQAEGPSDGHEHVRPRRQGHLHRCGHPGSEAVTTRIDQRFADLKKQGRAALVTFVTAGDPDYDTSLEDHQGPAQGRRRCHRIRHALHRSHGRWPGHPGGGLARARLPARR